MFSQVLDECANEIWIYCFHIPWHDDKDYFNNVSYMFTAFYCLNAFNDAYEYLCIYRRPFMCSYTADCNLMVCILCFDISRLQMCTF